METAIKRAIEGGWGGNWKKIPNIEMLEHSCVGFSYDGMTEGKMMSIYDILYQQSFWQALGKAEGWEEEYYCNYCNSLSSKGCPDDCAYFVGKKPEWHYHWHRFIDHIAEGKDIDSFFNELLK